MLARLIENHNRSTPIFENKIGKFRLRLDKLAVVAHKEALRQYVKRIMQAKRLSLRDVQRQSGRGVTQGYVGGIIQGKYANLTVKKLMALARGLGVDEEELFRVACGLPARESPDERADSSHQLLMTLELMRKVATNPRLKQILEEAAELSSENQAFLLKTIKLLNEAGPPAELGSETA